MQRPDKRTQGEGLFIKLCPLRGLVSESHEHAARTTRPELGRVRQAGPRRSLALFAPFTPELEVYSIDEAFLSLEGFNRNQLTGYAHLIRQRVRQWTGMPVSIGIGSTKVLAKIANKVAKEHRRHDGVFMITDNPEIDTVLDSIEAGEIWGIGRRSATLLKRHAITTARDLKYAPDAWVRQHLTVVGLRVVWELRGIPCIPLEEAPPPKKGIGSSRSFGRPVESLLDLIFRIGVWLFGKSNPAGFAGDSPGVPN